MKIDLVSKRKGTTQLPTVDVYYSWFGEVRKYCAQYKTLEKKYVIQRLLTKDLGNVFVVGINTNLI